MKRQKFKNDRIRAIVFDMDGTLVTQKSSWQTVHKYFNTLENASHNLAAYEKGEIDYTEFMRRDISLWPKQLTIKKVKEILSRFTIAPGAYDTVHGFKERGFQVFILSAGIDVLAEIVASKVGILQWMANGLETNHGGVLTGEGIFRVDLMNKENALKKLLLNPQECLAVGDSKYDISLLKCSAIGVALGECEDLRKIADISVSNLSELIDLHSLLK